MAQEKNYLLRALVPIIVGLVGLGVVVAVYRTGTQTAPQPAQPAASQPASPVAPAQQAAASEQPPAAAPSAAPAQAAAPAITPPPQAPAPPAIAGIRVQEFAPADAPAEPLGSLDPAAGFQAQVEFSAIGAGIREMRLAQHFDTIKRTSQALIQAEMRREAFQGTVKIEQIVAPMAALAIEVNGVVLPLAGSPERPVWRTVEGSTGRESRTFEAFVLDAADTPVLRLTRTFRLAPGSYDLAIDQRIENLSASPVSARWFQFGPVDLPQDAQGYGGDKRRVRYGYLLKPSVDPTRQFVMATDFLKWRQEALGSADDSGLLATERQLWPNRTSEQNEYTLVWAAMTNRYFGVALHPMLDPAAANVDKRLTAAERIDRIVLAHRPGESHLTVPMALRLTSSALAIAPGASASVNVGVYAGPLSTKAIEATPAAAKAGVGEIVVYNFGGPCGWCTFPFLTHGLLGTLHFLHDYIVFDWSLAIVVLVILVRTILHPVQRWSQIRIQRFGKQMQAIAPKAKEVQEKYKNDRKKLNEEMQRLWREEGINPAGALGCLPLFLQTPIWIALYAMLYFAVELRHEPAFFGVFQAIQPSGSPFWWFLGDLAEPDRLWYFGQYFSVPLLSGLLGPISSVNVLPLILGVVFFYQQKYMSPPTMTLTPEQQQQQKIMKFMLVVMFPFFMYNAPSGLAIYFIVNSTLGIIESRWIKAHIEKHDLLNVKAAPKPAAGKAAAAASKQPTGFLARLQQMAEQKKAEAERRMRENQRKKK